jgi:adenylate cyclase
MAPEEFKRKLSAILSADVEGYSRLMGEDEDATIRTLTTYRELMSKLIQKHRGRVVDSPGDNLLAEFGSVVDAVRCAVEIQEELRVRNAELPENRRMHFRIGINLGDVVEEGERIYGDGVNIAARVEGLAEGGGICISGTVYDSIKNKLTLSYEPIGEHAVKNIKEPVRVYRMRVGPEAVTQQKARPKRWMWPAVAAVIALIIVAGAVTIWNFFLRRPSVEPASVDRMSYTLPTKPSIAVLPFTNMSGDPEQDYIGDSLSENIISALSHSSQLFVIARNSTFTYKRKAVKVQHVAEDLGVRYVLEGSIQKSGDRLRVTAQLIDALTGHHLWSEKYDRKMKDFFDLQDEITKMIVISLRVELIHGEDYRVYSKSTNNLEALKHWIKGSQLYAKWNKEDSIKARKHFQTAIELDPEFVGAWVSLSWVHLTEAMNRWSDSPSISFKRAFELVHKALEIDDQSPFAHTQLGNIYTYQKQHEKAITEYKLAITLNPNFAQAHASLARSMAYSGRFDEAISLMKKALRLDPKLPPISLATLCESYISLGRYEEAREVISQMEKHVQRGDFIPKFMPPLMHSNLYKELGREEEARAYMAEALKHNPTLPLELFKGVDPKQIPPHVQRLLDAQSKAAPLVKPPLPLPDKPSIAVLPFMNMSGDPEQDYIGDGLSENIISALSLSSKLFVIARNSTFTYKGKPVKVQQVAEELGVQYVLEGSIQKSGDRLRVTAQLIDALKGHHLWSDVYDREMRELFDLQDEITKKIVVSVGVELTGGEDFRVFSKSTDNLQAWKRYIKGIELAEKMNKADNAKAREHFETALELDPDFVSAWVALARTHWADRRWVDTPSRSVKRAFELIQKALKMDEQNPEAHSSLGIFYLYSREHGKAIIEGKRAIVLNPNFAQGYAFLAWTMYCSGRFEEAISLVKEAYRLNPKLVPMGHITLGESYIFLRRYDEALEVFNQLDKHDLIDIFEVWVRIGFSFLYQELGKEEEAREYMAEALKINPNLSLEKFVSKTHPFKNRIHQERMMDALRKAGMPEKAQRAIP